MFRIFCKLAYSLGPTPKCTCLFRSLKWGTHIHFWVTMALLVNDNGDGLWYWFCAYMLTLAIALSIASSFECPGWDTTCGSLDWLVAWVMELKKVMIVLCWVLWSYCCPPTSLYVSWALSRTVLLTFTWHGGPKSCLKRYSDLSPLGTVGSFAHL